MYVQTGKTTKSETEENSRECGLYVYNAIEQKIDHKEEKTIARQ
jgi:hypothetical protein